MKDLLTGKLPIDSIAFLQTLDSEIERAIVLKHITPEQLKFSEAIEEYFAKKPHPDNMDYDKTADFLKEISEPVPGQIPFPNLEEFKKYYESALSDLEKHIEGVAKQKVPVDKHNREGITKGLPRYEKVYIIQEECRMMMRVLERQMDRVNPTTEHKYVSLLLALYEGITFMSNELENLE